VFLTSPAERSGAPRGSGRCHSRRSVKQQPIAASGPTTKVAPMMQVLAGTPKHLRDHPSTARHRRVHARHCQRSFTAWHCQASACVHSWHYQAPACSRTALPGALTPEHCQARSRRSTARRVHAGALPGAFTPEHCQARSLRGTARRVHAGALPGALTPRHCQARSRRSTARRVHAGALSSIGVLTHGTAGAFTPGALPGTGVLTHGTVRHVHSEALPDTGVLTHGTVRHVHSEALPDTGVLTHGTASAFTPGHCQAPACSLTALQARSLRGTARHRRAHSRHCHASACSLTATPRTTTKRHSGH